MLTLVGLATAAQAEDIPFEQAPADNAVAPGPDTAAPPPSATGATSAPAPSLEKLPPPQATSPMPVAPAPRRGKQAPAELSGLGNLAPFNDIAVISRRFLPKTHRFEFFPNVGLVLNDAFFNDVFLGGRAGYYFTENYGVEIMALAISSTPKSVTDELKSVRLIQTDSLVTPISYYGADFKWAPVYGKLGWLNHSIVPFDLYFSVGGGVTGTNQNTTPPTFHIGTGQIFAIKKWMAARWDLSYFLYNSTSTVAGGSSGAYSNLHFTLGMSFFFPEAEYR
jgi:outer membrane beta-barrel protein